MTLHKVYPDSVGDEVMTGEPVPLLAHAHGQVEILDRGKINARNILFRCARRVDGQQAGDIEKSGQFLRLKGIDDG
jgi:hypothetical protein